ncbi:MAG: GMP synthase subunit A [Candidatus Altiarchaeota archaeon]
MILIIDNGGQYVHRIWRSLKYLGAESKIISNYTPLEEIRSANPEGIILSGGPYSVYADADRMGVCRQLLAGEYPVLGICLGHQIMAQHFGGKVHQGDKAEYASVGIRILEEDDLFRGLPGEIQVWESHKDEVASMPDGFTRLAESDICSIEALKHNEKPLYSVQFHPEVEHTPDGMKILENFIRVAGKT